MHTYNMYCSLYCSMDRQPILTYALRYTASQSLL